MIPDKEIHFSEKKVDEEWKEQAWKDKQIPRQSSPNPAGEPQTSKAFLNFLTSLGLQALIHLGETVHPETQKSEVNPEAAREIIDLLVQFREKTKGNLSAEEMEFFNRFLPELQMKFAQRV